jgi:type III secretory pathway component EscT
MSLLVASVAGHVGAAAHGAPSLVGLVEEALRARGVDLARLGLAWARATPAVTLVPAFGLRALPTVARGVLAVTLAVAIFPALPAASSAGGPLWIALLGQVAAGVPVAIAAAVPLWAATMAGGVADALRGMSDSTAPPTVEGSATPTGVALSLLACSMFFATGGPARIATALALSTGDLHPVLRASEDISHGISIAVALGGPLLAASVVVEVAGALIARAATPAQLHLLLAPLRALALLGVLAIVFSRMSEALAAVVAHARL